MLKVGPLTELCTSCQFSSYNSLNFRSACKLAKRAGKETFTLIKQRVIFKKKVCLLKFLKLPNKSRGRYFHFFYTNYSINCFVFYYYLLLLLLYLITCYSPQGVKILISAPLIQNHVFRVLKVLLKSELRQINFLFTVPNNCAHYTSLVY